VASDLNRVIALAQESHDFEILLGSRSVEKGKKVLDLLSSPASSLKGSVSLLQIDVTDQKSISAAKDDVETKFGRLDVLINNAGDYRDSPDRHSNQPARDFRNKRIWPDHCYRVF
jgi:NAD(P)-dependent dehydrogenase (short-subunit alcohol dehydrogenase family)